jgi:hypothetical protein
MFTISVINDRINFADVVSGISRGTTTELEKYVFPAEVLDKRSVMVTVTQSTANSPISIAETSEVGALGAQDAVMIGCQPLCIH